MVDTRWGRLGYEDGGRGGPPVRSHANPGDRRDGDGARAALAARCRVLALDGPGVLGALLDAVRPGAAWLPRLAHREAA